jgi:sn-glycerol 3-phosphate transport system substrate-binding protein
MTNGFFFRYYIVRQIKSIFTLFLLVYAIQAEEVYLWHALDGPLKESFEKIVDDFNPSQGDIKVIPLKQANYKVLVEETLLAFENKKHPHIVQVYEVAAPTFIANEALYRPITGIDPSRFMDVARRFYSRDDGQLAALPWNASTGILFYNKEAFQKAGLDPESPPKTWEEFEAVALALKKVGIIGYTTAWPSAYHLEHVASLHNIPIATEENGFGGKGAQLKLSHPLLIKHWSKVAEWHSKGYFSYRGSFSDEPEKFFTDEKCGILLQGANRLPLLLRKASFPIGLGPIPYWKSEVETPYTLNTGGGALFVMSGFSEELYAKIQPFLKYLSSPEVQTRWHQETGYLPISKAAYEKSLHEGFYENHPAHRIAAEEVLCRPIGKYSFGVRLENYIELREQIVSQFEKLLRGELTPQQALEFPN